MLRRLTVPLLTLLWLLPLAAQAQLTAAFTVSPASPVCVNTIVTFTDQSTGGATSWAWDFGTQFGGTSTLQNPTFNFWQTGTYTVTLTVSDGVNTATTTQTIVVEGPDFDYTLYDMSPNFSNCGPMDATVSYSGTLNGTWVWDMGDGNTYANVTNFTHTYQSGFYNNKITVTDPNGCADDFWLDSVFVGTDLCVEGVVTDISCNPPTLGSIDLTVNGGTPPFTFSWSNGATTEDLSGLSEGTYTVVVTDASGNTTTESFTIDNSLIDLDFVVGLTDCSGTGGSLDLTITGGTAPYTITWSTGATGVTSLTNLDAGGYSVTVVDANGCTDHEPVFVLYEDSCRVNVSGSVYLDFNQNCVFDPGVDVPYQGWIESSTGDQDHAWQGSYSMNLPAGPIELEAVNFAFSSFNPYFNVACPVGNQHNLPFQTNDSTGLDFAFQADTSVHDLGVHQYFGPPIRPGFVHQNHVIIRNYGTVIETPSVTWTHDALVDYISATPAPTNYDATTRTATWTLGPLSPTQFHQITIVGYADSTLPLGTLVTNVASVTGDPAETALANNVDSTTTTVVGSYDPNDKQVNPIGLGRSGAVDESTEWFEYLIRFQNTGTDTAFFVTIRDTLDPDFDRRTVQPLGSSHEYVWRMGKNGEMEFFFDNILLPDSGTNLAASQGFVAYRVRRRAEAQVGTQLTNTAAIYFDFNAPIITNTTVNTLIRTVSVVGQSGSDLRVYPNPSQGQMWVEAPTGTLQTLTLRNAAGQRVMQRNLAGETRHQLDLRPLPLGLYLLEVQSSQGRSVHKLLIEE